MREGWAALRCLAGFHLDLLRAVLRELFHPVPFVDDDPQSTDEATAARTAWVQANHLSDEEVARMKKDWNW